MYSCKYICHSKIRLWDNIQGNPIELTNRLWKCWMTLSIITVHWAQLHSPRQTECWKCSASVRHFILMGKRVPASKPQWRELQHHPVSPPHSWTVKSDAGDTQPTLRVRTEIWFNPECHPKQMQWSKQSWNFHGCGTETDTGCRL